MVQTLWSHTTLFEILLGWQMCCVATAVSQTRWKGPLNFFIFSFQKFLQRWGLWVGAFISRTWLIHLCHANVTLRPFFFPWPSRLEFGISSFQESLRKSFATFTNDNLSPPRIHSHRPWHIFICCNFQRVSLKYELEVCIIILSCKYSTLKQLLAFTERLRFKQSLQWFRNCFHTQFFFSSTSEKKASLHNIIYISMLSSFLR